MSDTPTDDELRQWRALCEAATAGPWYAMDGAVEGFDGMWDVAGPDDCGIASLSDGGTGVRPDKLPRDLAANAELIAGSRTAMPRLLDEVERLRAKLAAMKAVGCKGAE